MEKYFYLSMFSLLMISYGLYISSAVVNTHIVFSLDKSSDIGN